MRVDCAATVRCEKRQESAAIPANPRAHLWRPVWRAQLLDDVDVIKLKAHRTEDAAAGRIAALGHRGNELADQFAKRGARLAARAEGDVRFILGARATARDIMQFAASLEAAIGRSGEEGREHDGLEVLRKGQQDDEDVCPEDDKQKPDPAEHAEAEVQTAQGEAAGAMAPGKRPELSAAAATKRRLAPALRPKCQR